MASNNQPMKGTETTTTTNSGNEQELRVVDTVDYRLSAGEEERTKENIQITHQTLPTDSGDGPGEKGIFTGAAEAVANTVRSTKEAITTNNPK